jgi:hypothetical protein
MTQVASLHRVPASGRIEIRRGMFPMHSYWEIPDDTANGDDTKRVISVAENVSIKVSTNDKSHFCATPNFVENRNFKLENGEYKFHFVFYGPQLN